ncbi:MAG: hypothetical protein ACOZBH_05185 [Patescibacteria group bacterium]
MWYNDIMENQNQGKAFNVVVVIFIIFMIALFVYLMKANLSSDRYQLPMPDLSETSR